MKRPKTVEAPPYLTPSPPVPKPAPIDDPSPPNGEQRRLEPTRYGDWEKNGIAVDF